MATTGSFINNLMSNSRCAVPEIGMGVTQLCWTDRHPFTMIDIINDKTLVVQADESIRVDNNGMSDSQKYEYKQNPEGSIYIITLRKNGYWVTKGSSMKSGQRWHVGSRSRYYDFTFQYKNFNLCTIINQTGRQSSG